MLRHWIWLSRCKGIGHVSAKKLLRMFGTAENIYSLTYEQCLSAPRLPQRIIDSIMDKDMGDIDEIVARCDQLGIRFVTYADCLYPERLRQIPDPPIVLYYKGTLPNIDKEAVIGIVGTRASSNYGIVQAKQYASLIALSGGVIVSGGARGIDTVALHSGLGSILPVICVLAGGLDEYYPPENRGLFEAICQHGCVISEYPPGQRPHPKNFLARNRIISGLSVGLLVVEAPKGSGSLTTARYALEQNRDVYTIRRADGGERCMGNQELLDAGCEAVKDGWDILSHYLFRFPNLLIDGRTAEAARILYQARFGANTAVYSPVLREPFGFGGSTAPSTPDSAPYKVERPRDLTEVECKVLSVFDHGPVEMDTIIARSGLSPADVGFALTTLQIKKRIIKNFGNSYQRI